ncbi:hypothetical protein SAMN05216289_11628 [Dokdonella immobilis]|uniref:Erythromycin esterase n=1 Tax=Dokdonella immobilis TaxID=578942 RepID=A0A1I4YAR7_9GAMM|nr:hypothetical protein SAMN05216289_11628 [Dokdonella immobilis]
MHIRSRSRHPLIRCGCALAFLLVAAHAASAEKQVPPALKDALTEVRADLVMSDQGFSGEGAAILDSAVRQSRFVLLGEDHFSREIPRFTANLCDIMKPDAYAVEAGPEAARFVTSVLRSPTRRKQIAEHARTWPNSIAFLDVVEENDAAAHCAGVSRNPRFALWGLDQEFLGATGTLLEAMRATRPGPAALAAIADLMARDTRIVEQSRQSGDPGQLLLLSATEADLKPLADAITTDGNDATRRLLDELLVSRRIYRLNAEGSPDSNSDRAQLFKQHFLAEYAETAKKIAQPRILFKFGDNHSGKGFSPLQVRDIGNFVAEFADGEKAGSLHIMVFGARGKHGAFAGYDRPLKDEPFAITDYPEYRWMEPAVAGMLADQEKGAGTTLTLYDLRKLRFRHIDMPPDWKRIVFSYDLMVLMPEISASSLIR